MSIQRAVASKRLVSAILLLDERSINKGVVDEANDAAFTKLNVVKHFLFAKQLPYCCIFFQNGFG